MNNNNSNNNSQFPSFRSDPLLSPTTSNNSQFNNANDSLNNRVYNAFINMSGYSNSNVNNTQSRINEEEEEEEEDEEDEVEEGEEEEEEAEEGEEKEEEEEEEEEENDREQDDEEFMYTNEIKKLESRGLIDIGNLATWTVSSFKQGYGVSQLRNESPFTYWQSDGQQPHFLTIHFTKCVKIERICIYLNYSLDESYTPSKINIFAGTGEHDLIEVSNIELVEPVGWQNIDFDLISKKGFLKCYLIKIGFLTNHQNGKDSHVRSIKIFSPIIKNNLNTNSNLSNGVGFTSVKLLQESFIR